MKPLQQTYARMGKAFPRVMNGHVLGMVLVGWGFVCEISVSVGIDSQEHVAGEAAVGEEGEFG